MKRTMRNGLPKQYRRIESFRPCGPVAAMIDNETRGRGFGAKTALYERALVELLGAKYPKLKARWLVLHEEANGKAVAA